MPYSHSGRCPRIPEAESLIETQILPSERRSKVKGTRKTTMVTIEVVMEENGHLHGGFDPRPADSLAAVSLAANKILHAWNRNVSKITVGLGKVRSYCQAIARILAAPCDQRTPVQRSPAAR
jgi:hypothetical protein